MPGAEERIRYPEDLGLPADKGRLEEVFSSLSPEGSQRLSREFVEALIESRDASDLRPLQRVVESWYRTLLFAQRESYNKGVAEISEAVNEAEALPAADFLRALDL